MRSVLLVAFVAISSAATAADTIKLSRKDLLDVDVVPSRQIGNVTIQEITLPPSFKAPAHTHPCPVVGTVTGGRIVYQVDGEPARTLTAGSAFYEPADTTIARFDNADSVDSTFHAVYLCENKDEPLIHLAPPE